MIPLARGAAGGKRSRRAQGLCARRLIFRGTKGGMTMEYTGKEQLFSYQGRTLRLLNQSCPEWTHPYGYPDDPREADDNLHDAGCGIFSVAHLIDWVTGKKASVEELADFSMATGGRGDDGNDRPVLLAAMEAAGRLREIGLRYDGDGLVNDHEALWETLENGGYALTDLRVGHIVAIVDHRVKGGERQLLIIDSSRDSMHPAVRGDIREIVPGTEVYAKYVNRCGVCTGEGLHYAMYWVPLEKPFDFNLLHKIG